MTQRKQTNTTIMTALTPNQQEILKVIFERAYELEQKAEEYRGMLFTKNASYDEISNAALKQAFKEFEENKATFDRPEFI